MTGCQRPGPHGGGEKKIRVGDPREKRLLDAWRLLRNNRMLQTDFLRIMEDLARGGGVRSTRP